MATGSSINNSDGYSSIPDWGDHNTPTSDWTGQHYWIKNTLCAIDHAGITRVNYHATYDTVDLWNSYPWYQPISVLGWSGFWGLKTTVYGGFANKTSLTTYADSYSAHFPDCTGGNYNTYGRIPYATLTPANDYFTLGQPVRVSWTVFDADTLSLNRAQNPIGGVNKSVGCQPDKNGTVDDVGAAVVGSCAYTDLQPYSYTGFQSVALTGVKIQPNYPYGSMSTQASASVNIGESALAQNAISFPYVGQNMFTRNGGTAAISGNGFSVNGGNVVYISGPGGYYAYFWAGQPGFQDKSYRNIWLTFPALAPGGYYLYVWNGLAPYWSAPLSVTVP